VGEVCRGGGGLKADVRTHRGIVAKSTRAYMEGEGSVFAYVLNGRPLSLHN
jgi:hypothetical protein